MPCREVEEARLVQPGTDTALERPNIAFLLIKGGAQALQWCTVVECEIMGDSVYTHTG